MHQQTVYTSVVQIIIPCLFLFAAILETNAQQQDSASALLNSLGRTGAIQNPVNPCLGINCAYGQYCAIVNMGTSAIRTYQCRTIPVVNTPVPQCYDRVEVRVPAVNNNAVNRGAFAGSSSPGRQCLNQCANDSSCGGPGSGRICCMQGCDRICYRPKTTIVDYTNTTPMPLSRIFR